MEEKKACPLISTSDKLAVCQRERCAMWIEARNPKWSMCGIRQLTTDVHSIRFELKDALANAPLNVGQTIHS